MVSVEDIKKKAEEIREYANDLRMIEVLGGPVGQGFPPQFVEGYNDSDSDDWDRLEYKYRREIGDTDTSTFGTEFDYIPGLFELYAGTNDQNDHDEVMAQLDQAALALAPDDNEYIENPEIKNMSDKAGAWSGSFPEAFRQEIVNKAAYLIPNQRNIVRELGAAVKGHWNIVEAAREGLYSTAEATANTLLYTIRTYGEYNGKGGTDVDGAKVGKVLLSVAGAAIAITGAVTAVPSGGSSVPVTLAVLGAIKSGGDLASVAADGIEKPDMLEQGETGLITGSTVDEIIGSMNDCLDLLLDEVIQEQKAQAALIEETLDNLATYRKEHPSQLVPYESAFGREIPELGSDQFRHSG